MHLCQTCAHGYNPLGRRTTSARTRPASRSTEPADRLADQHYYYEQLLKAGDGHLRRRQPGHDRARLVSTRRRPVGTRRSTATTRPLPDAWNPGPGSWTLVGSEQRPRQADDPSVRRRAPRTTTTSCGSRASARPPAARDQRARAVSVVGHISRIRRSRGRTCGRADPTRPSASAAGAARTRRA